MSLKIPEGLRSKIRGHARTAMKAGAEWFESVAETLGVSSGEEWFESIAEAQRKAQKRLPKSVYMALVAGTEKGDTLADNEAAFSELGFAPYVIGYPKETDMATEVMGQPLSMPVMISPTGVQAVHPEGEVAVARAAAERGL